MITLYDEQEIVERYVKSEVAEAVAEAVEQTEKETALRSVIETCQDLVISMANTVMRIVLKFNLTQSEAEKIIWEYWKQLYRIQVSKFLIEVWHLNLIYSKLAEVSSIWIIHRILTN